MPEVPGDLDLYALLGLEPRATPEQLERAYRFSLELYAEGSLATYSLLAPTEAEARRARVREAYETLSDAQRRHEYDESRGFRPPDPALPESPAAESVAGGTPLPDPLTGAALRRLRETRGVSLGHIAAVTKIGVRFLEYIEQDRFAYLPPPVYLRGFLHEYGRLLGLEPRALAEAYLARLR